MRLTLDPRARRLLRALPRTSLYAVSELVLLALLAWQIARLVWAVVTPVSPLGDWRPAATGAAAAPAPGVLAAFDPFFRLTADGPPAVVTDLDLKLYGVRADQATGRGSAIIGTPGGKQVSVIVGEQVVPGVSLLAVTMDGVTILRNGARQMLYIDQSKPADAVGADPVGSGPPPPPIPGLSRPGPPPPVSAAGGGVVPSALAAQIGASPRIQGGRIDGFTLQPQGDGAAFRAAGLQPGDVLVAVNGNRVLNADSIAALPALIGTGTQATLEVERGGRIVPLSVSVAR